jgi:hypothetical protein
MDLYWQILVELPSVKVHGNLFTSSRVALYVRKADGLMYLTSYVLHEVANASTNPAPTTLLLYYNDEMVNAV